jgi:hypothetical protein
MTNLAFGSQKAEKIAPSVEELLRKETGAGGPIVYEIEDAGTADHSIKSLLKDLGTTAFGGDVTLLFKLHFHLTQPRAADLAVDVIRQGMGAYAGSLAYAAVLSRKVGSKVALGDGKQFSGDADAAAKLNASKDLLKKCNAFAMTSGGITGFEISIARRLEVQPREGGALLVAVTLPRSKMMGLSASMASKEFFELVNDLEAAL